MRRRHVELHLSVVRMSTSITISSCSVYALSQMKMKSFMFGIITSSCLHARQSAPMPTS